MAHLVRNRGLDLPVYDRRTTVLSKKHEFTASQFTPESTFVRTVRLQAYGCLTLRQALDVADSAFMTFTELCDASVVPHSWGLYRFSKDNHRSEDPLLPGGHILVAEVDKVRAVQARHIDQTIAIANARTTYLKQQREGTNPLTWYEHQPYQFLNGVTDNDSHRRLYMVDIEPILERM